MTVVYAHKLATASGFGRGFLNLLFLWKGSVYKLVWRNLLVWLTLYYAISFWYRFGMASDEKRVFEFLCRYCEKYSSLIPLSFVLGFYVNLVVNRWWQMWDALPWPDNIAMFVTTSIQGQDERARLMRRTILRYVNLASVHSMAMFSPRVRKRFPTLDHFVSAGLLTEDERQILDVMSKQVKKLYFVPLVWAATIITKARNEGKIKSDFQWKSCLDHIVEFRQRCGRSLHIDIINVPLVYSQVVTLAVYTFFLACLLGRQFIQNDKYVMDLYFPIFTVLQFVFYLGWLKVAETLVNPYGEDDDDFELNWMIDRHLKTSYMIVDEMNEQFPDLVKDPYWEDVIPQDLPHTEESQEAEEGRETPDLLGSMLDVPSSFEWRGSVYKLVWKSLLVWLTVFYALGLWYRFGMDDDEKKIFEYICKYCDKASSLIPLSFVLGFYVKHVLDRWWAMWEALPTPDNIALFVTTSIQGQDEQSRLLRRTIMRYVNLASVYSMVMFSPRVRKRFPTMHHFVAAGLLNEDERRILDQMSEKMTKLYYVPLIWAATILTKARSENKIKSDSQWKGGIDHILLFREKCGRSLLIDTINTPLVYTQVVTLATYMFLLACLLGRQFTDGEKNSIDLYIPIFTILQIIVYLGWLKVAETLLNPYGEDDDDFELNWLIERNLKTSYMIVDEMNDDYPDLVKDPYWEQVIPPNLPHTLESEAAEEHRPSPPDLLGSMLDVPSSANTPAPSPEPKSPGFRRRNSASSHLRSIRDKLSFRRKPRNKDSESEAPEGCDSPCWKREEKLPRLEVEDTSVRRASSSPSVHEISEDPDSPNISNPPKRAQSLFDRIKLKSTKSLISTAKKFRVQDSGEHRNSTKHNKYAAYADEGVDILPSVEEAPALAEAAAEILNLQQKQKAQKRAEVKISIETVPDNWSPSDSHDTLQTSGRGTMESLTDDDKPTESCKM
ncbi:unnamed protein product [Notodromas monacha]|uniref:Bestrophin homolog n=1 Tax=Notodromas monacha TaxID=399045 RepID=A0A7R9BVF1_9CRUS|nr:unnamed protein product [Notodromas monacha]CAG0922466.1 unnamed protein product [Notodromas monacha]